MTPPSTRRPVVDPESGRVFVVSGPSGSGKSTVIAELLKLEEFPLEFSVSATSRQPRPGEVDGVHYYFLSREDFLKKEAQHEFLESAIVHGNLYGTLRSTVETAMRNGRWVLLDIDIQGFRQVKSAMPEITSLFFRLPTMDAYEARLRSRGTESEGELAERLADVRAQLAEAASYDFQIVNETVEQAVRTFRTLLWGLYFLQKGGHNDR